MKVKARAIRNTYDDSERSNPLLSDSSSARKRGGWRRALLVWLPAGLTALFLLAGAFKAGQIHRDTRTAALLSEKDEEIESIKARRPAQPEFELKIHESGTPITLQKNGDVGRDACELLSTCFTSEHFVADPVRYPHNPLARCHYTLNYVLNSFDSGFYYENGRLVGFASSEVQL